MPCSFGTKATVTSPPSEPPPPPPPPPPPEADPPLPSPPAVRVRVVATPRAAANLVARASLPGPPPPPSAAPAAGGRPAAALPARGEGQGGGHAEGDGQPRRSCSAHRSPLGVGDGPPRCHRARRAGGSQDGARPRAGGRPAPAGAAGRG